jgi:hypothetical protein
MNFYNRVLHQPMDYPSELPAAAAFFYNSSETFD